MAVKPSRRDNWNDKAELAAMAVKPSRRDNCNDLPDEPKRAWLGYLARPDISWNGALTKLEALIKDTRDSFDQGQLGSGQGQPTI
jgi:hypothetical protein